MDDVESISQDFWSWRAAQQPRTTDDIPRLDRPDGWLPEFSSQDVARYLAALAEFEQRLDALAEPGEQAAASDRAAVVDSRLLRSAFARVRWEFEVLRLWQRHPGFYVDQTVGVVFDLLTPPNPTAATLGQITRILTATPTILDTGRANLAGHAVQEFAQLTVSALEGIDQDLRTTAEALATLKPDGWTTDGAEQLHAAAEQAGAALTAFAHWLQDIATDLEPWQPVGHTDFQWFLRNVALVPYSPEQILDLGRQELHRAVALELLERNKNGTSGDRAAPPSRFATGAQQSAAQVQDEAQVRRFYAEQDLLTLPEELRSYHTQLFPDYLWPLVRFGTADDLTGPNRLQDNGAAFFPPPDGPLPYFYAANAHDPRAGIIHEGSHYQQLVLSWQHPRPVRRHYYDSTPNEGIAFYNEELMLAAGLFEDAPHTREIIYNFMRLRALRVVVDIGLAVGDFDIDSAGDFLERNVPMDRETARHEAAFFASTPGQAMTYQVGKTQILALLADAKLAQGNDFTLRQFHDRLWREGNVPLALQRWELLGDRSDLDRLTPETA